MNEQEFNQWLQKKTEDTPVPEALLPDYIAEQLNHKPRRKKWLQHPWLNVAAGFLLLGIITSAIWTVQVQHKNPECNSIADIENSMMEESAIEDAYIDNPQTNETISAEITEATQDSSAIQTVTSYKQLYELLNEFAVADYNTCFESSLAINDAVTFDAESSFAYGVEKDSNSHTEANYYDTNSQVEQVAEADIVKTDGTYIYSCYQQDDYAINAVAIAKADAGNLTAYGIISSESIVAEIQCEDFMIEEMYILNQKLILLCNGYHSTKYEQTNTYILTYDVSNPKQPKLLDSLVQDGSYRSSRLVNGYLYTFSTEFSRVPEDYSAYDLYVPHTDNNRLSCYDIFLPECPDSSHYQIMTGMAIDQPEQFISSKAILSGIGTYYVSAGNIYFAQQGWKNGASNTEILKFSYIEGVIQPEGSIIIDGYLLNQFSMDEYNGYLRVAATVTSASTQTNALYVIDADMNLVGTIENLAPEERIYSARFMGDTGYFVTYRETDPLFAVDLSDPENPQITDTLKIPGFSNYLHFYSEDLLFGLGEETNPSTGEFMGIKLSMFDISDPYHIEEVDKTVFSDITYTTAQYNHKTLMIAPERNLIGFYVVRYDEINYESQEDYVIYSYQPDKGFQEVFTCHLLEDATMSDDLVYYNMDFSLIRGLYIDDYLYLVKGNHMISYSLDTFEKIDGLIIQNN